MTICSGSPLCAAALPTAAAGVFIAHNKSATTNKSPSSRAPCSSSLGHGFASSCFTQAPLSPPFVPVIEKRKNELRGILDRLCFVMKNKRRFHIDPALILIWAKFEETSAAKSPTDGIHFFSYKQPCDFFKIRGTIRDSFNKKFSFPRLKPSESSPRARGEKDQIRFFRGHVHRKKL
jgi:hypothetical protein